MDEVKTGTYLVEFDIDPVPEWFDEKWRDASLEGQVAHFPNATSFQSMFGNLYLRGVAGRYVAFSRDAIRKVLTGDGELLWEHEWKKER